MAYKNRLALFIILDSVIVSIAVFIGFWLAYPHFNIPYNVPVLLMTSVAILVFHHIYALMYKLYNKVWVYASVGELVAIVKAVTLTILSAGLFQFVINDFEIYRRGLVITWMLHVLMIGGSRFFWRIIKDKYNSKTGGNEKRTLIVGAGDAGAMIARQLNTEHNPSELLPVAFVDDAETKQKMQVYNLTVFGRVKDIPRIVRDKAIEHIIIAIPSLKNSELKQIIGYCNQTNAKVQMIPKLEDLMTGKVSVNSLKNVEVEDLLGRETVVLDMDSIKDTVTGKTVMLTGAGGSIGSELCRQLMRFSPGKIVLIGHGEYSIYQIDKELRSKFGQDDVEIIPVIADVKDRKRMVELVRQYQPKIIYHAAAHKHVPLMEYNAHEAVKNNIMGTKNVAEAAAACDVDTFVLVSTDKAVKPTNVMGATKRIAEMIVQNLNPGNKTNFVAVRFGNVLGSRGSVIPLFKEQMEQGGPVTVTDPEMTRYFMTIPEASRLVIQAGTLANGGEIFVLDMGEPVKINDLAKNLIHLSGYTEDEIEIEYTGLRPGEKMYEELLNDDEILPGQVYDKIYVGRTFEVDEKYIAELLEDFITYDSATLKDALMRIVYMERELLRAKGS